MAEYTKIRPTQDVRLRNWDAGRVAQLKLIVDKLESSINQTAPATVAQSEMRRVSDQVPIIIDLLVTPGYRQFTIDFSIPPGLGGHPFRQLLFYEIQHDTTAGFTDPTIVQTPQRHISIGNIGLAETRYFRARVVNTQNFAGPWTDTITSTAARGIFATTPIVDAKTRLEPDVGQWGNVLRFYYTPTGGAISLNSHISMAAIQRDVTVTNRSGGSYTLFGGAAHVQFRWRVGTTNPITLITSFREFGERTILSARPGYTGIKLGKTPLAFGAFMTPFERFGSGVQILFELQASKMPGTEWKGGASERALQTSDPLIFSRNGVVLEVQEQF